MAEPEPEPVGPTGVWLEYADGTRYDDLPTVYVGLDPQGIALFEVLTPRDEHPVQAGMRHFPGKTSIRLPRIDPRRE